MDYFTKWAEAIATPNKSACQVANALFKLFMRMGIPRVITTDQGSEFNNQLNQQLMTVLEIDHRLITTYHPQVSIAATYILCTYFMAIHCSISLCMSSYTDFSFIIGGRATVYQ